MQSRQHLRRRQRTRAQIQELESRQLLSAALSSQTTANAIAVPATYLLSTEVSFNPSPLGAAPRSSVIVDSSGNLFGTTGSGGTANEGTVFEIPHGSSTPVTLLFFNGTNGYFPDGTLVTDAAGNIYGATFYGGANDAGAIFEIDHGTTTVTKLADLPADSGGGDISGLSIDATGNLYGATYNAFFELPAGFTTPIVLATIPRTITGSGPLFGVSKDAAGNLFGITQDGGTAGEGSIIEVPAGSSTPQTIFSFSGSNGDQPSSAMVMDAAGDLFGQTTFGGTNGGVLFELPASTRTYTVLADFVPATGTIAISGLTIDSSGNLYGTTLDGGANGYGTIYELPAGTNTIQQLASLSNATGDQNYTTLFRDSSGNLYGTAESGGAGARGTVFELPNSPGATPAATALYAFAGTDTASPEGGLVADAAGDLFGVSSSGGTLNIGGLFEIPHGTTTAITIASFPYDGEYESSANPVGLAIDADGDLFGDYGNSGLFEYNASTSTVAGFGGSFDNSDFGYVANVQPSGPLVVDASDDLFGVTATGGEYHPSDGTVFEMYHGQPMALANFDGTDGSSPQGAIVRDAAGDIFGTTNTGGVDNDGVLYELPVHQSTPVVLATFDGTNGSLPVGGLIADAAGNLYGTTSTGGPESGGTIFEFSPSTDTLTTLAAVPAYSGGGFVAPLTRDASGGLFGVTSSADGQRGDLVELPAGGNTIDYLGLLPGTGSTGALTLDTAGNLYGTLAGGGIGEGAVFRASPVSRLAFQQQPVNVTAGSTQSPAISVAVEDAAGAVANGDSSLVSLSIASGPTGGAITGTTAVQAVAGVATFGTISFSVPGTYVLSASDGSLQAATSTTFTVSAAPPAVGAVSGRVSAAQGGLANVTLFLDTNGDGQLDNGELSTTTTSSGTFSFSAVPTGSYILRQTLPTGYTQSTPPGNAGLAVNVTGGAALTNENFIDAAVPAGASISGTVASSTGATVPNITVYLDANNNSKLDTGELSTTATSTGAYSFTNVPAGAYIVRQVLPTGDKQVTPSGGLGIHITVSSGGSLTKENFVDSVPAATSPGGSVAGTVTASGAGLAGITVYLDANNNSTLDSGELSTTTGGGGAYSFSNVPAGAYVIRQVLPTGDKQVTPSGGLGIHITVTNGGSLTGENFTDTVPAAAAGGSIAGTVSAGGTGVVGETVYLDANNNSKLDAGELSAVTTTGGAYSFTNVPTGAYIIRQVLPTGYTQTSPGGGLGIHITVTTGGKLTGDNFTDTAPATKAVSAAVAITPAVFADQVSIADTVFDAGSPSIVDG